jgi:hypothetical protein
MGFKDWFKNKAVDGLSIKIEYNALGKRWFYLELKGFDAADMINKLMDMFSRKDKGGK